MSRLQGLAARVDALTLRERVILFVALAVLLVGVADQTVITGSLQQQQAWNAQLVREATELSALRAELARLNTAAVGGLPQDGTSAAPLLRELALATVQRNDLLARLRAIDGDSAHGVGPADLPALLARVLTRHGRVTLVHLSTRPAHGGPAAPPTAVPWQGASLSLTGSYADLQSFVAALELELPGLRWGALQLATDGGSPLLTVQLWLAGGQA
jgi:MSHA biogenesis protein MshJ